MANRIAAAIVRQRQEIARKLAAGVLTEERVEEIRREMDLHLNEFARFQEVKSLAHLEGVLTLAEAQLIFELLGGVPSVFNARDCATKAVLTQTFQELLRWQVRKAGGVVA